MKLTAGNTAGSNTATKTNYITVTAAPVAPVANFTANRTSGVAPARRCVHGLVDQQSDDVGVGLHQ